MKKLIIVPVGWACPFEECPSGLFVYNDNLFLKSKYTSPSGIKEAYCESGEYFHGGVSFTKERNKLIVQPVESRWVEE